MQISTTSSMSNRDGNKGGWGGDLNPCFCPRYGDDNDSLCLLCEEKSFFYPRLRRFFSSLFSSLFSFLSKNPLPVRVGMPKVRLKLSSLMSKFLFYLSHCSFHIRPATFSLSSCLSPPEKNSAKFL